MTSSVRLALFDCDGTLADSQHAIVSAVERAFAACGQAIPPAAQVRRGIGLSVPVAIARLAPGASDAEVERLADAYREAYFEARTAHGADPEPLFDGVVALLDELQGDGWTLGIATGKSRRGLERLLRQHGLTDRFATLQVADNHPSKPHPSMALAAMEAVGAAPAQTAVIGDTAHDMGLARAAGARALGVAWGYHDEAELTAGGAEAIASNPPAVAIQLRSWLA